MKRPLFILLALVCAPVWAADPEGEKPLGRSINQRFGKIDQGLVYNPGNASGGNARTFATRTAESPAFRYEQKVAPTNFQTREFSQQKTSWFSRLKFWARDATPKGDHEIPNANRQADVKAAPVKGAREADKLAAVRDLPDGNRPYLGPESKRLDRSVDPQKPLPGWTGDKMDTLTVEQVRELLNKNK